MQVAASAKETKVDTMENSTSMKLVDHSSIHPGLFGLHLDLPGEKVNKLGPVMMKELLENLEAIKKRSDIKGLVILSEKESIFIAGADISMIQTISDAQEGSKLAADGQKVIQKIEELPFPTVAAVHGACMGGGTELALCCKYILVSDSPSTKIALPEVNLGILPGFGGTVRLPKRIGLQAALDYVMTGKTMAGDKAVKLGLAEAVLPHQDFKKRALEWTAKAMKGQRVSQKPMKPFMARFMAGILEKTPFGRALVFSQARKMVMSKTRGHYPAPLKILEVMEKNAGRSKKDALILESKAFGELAITSVSKRLIELFFASEKVKKLTGVNGAKLDPTKQIKNSALLGAGVMGGGIAQLLAQKEVPVRMKDIDYKALALGVNAANKIFYDQVKKKKISRREAEIKLALISSTVEYSGFGRADMVLEAVVENMDIKKKVLKECEAVMRKDAFFASNTSSLSLTELATASSRPENVVGMHFFNPVHRMPLVEVIRGDKTSDEAVLAIYELSKRLGKTPIVVKDGPGFLVNRLLMPYLNEASYLMAEGAALDQLDEAVLDFGMPMGPVTLLDEIGLDVASKVAKILHQAFGARSLPCPLNEKLVQAKLLGRKTKKGFFVYDAQGKKQELNPEIYQVLGVNVVSHSKEQKSNWIPRMIYPMINEAALCLDEGIVADAETTDLGMIMGTGFPPFRGGLLRYADSVGVENVVSKLEELSKSVGARFAPSAPLVAMAKMRKRFYS